MRVLTLSEVNERIGNNRKDANGVIKATVRSTGRRKKSRTRTLGEQEALTQIAIAKWNKAVEIGKVKQLGERVFYYDYR